MTEPGLLASILADPGDDTARLVYADWLDEHDQPARAEYLRLHAEIAACEREGRGHVRLSARLREVAADLPAEWRAGAGRRVDVWLVSYLPAYKITTIKAIWYAEPQRPQLSEAARIVDYAPTAVKCCVLREDGEALQVAIEEATKLNPAYRDQLWAEAAACRVQLREPTPG